MKYLVMARAKHTANMSYCVISRNHPTQPMSIVTVTSVLQGRRSRQRKGPGQSMPRVTQLVNSFTKTPDHICQIPELNLHPPHSLFFFFFACWTYMSLLFSTTLHPFRIFFVIFNMITMLKPVCSNKYSFLSDIDCSCKINKIMISLYILTFSAYTNGNQPRI